MTNLINTKVLLSGAMIAAAAAVIIGATFAFFSDTETSTGNVFAAGEIDLQIDNESYVTNADGALVASTETSWDLRDLTVEKFFNFTDLKPGDIGEDTISIHVGSNDAWMCAAARVTQDTDETCTDPENADDPTCTDPNGDGELDDQVNFAFWKDDGDNIFESNESTFLAGPLSGLGEQGQIALSDSSDTGPFGDTPVPGGSTSYIGKAWCFGTLTPNPVTQDNVNTSNPLEAAGTGFTCDGSAVNNAAQTDKVVGDLQFYAVQSRNNDDFTCSQDYTPTWITRIDRTQLGFGDGGWAGWSCPAGTTAVGGGIDSSTNPVGGNGVAAPSAPAVDGFSYPVYPHYTFGAGETGYVVHDLPGDSLGNDITFHVDCQAN